MRNYIARRLFHGVVVLFAVSFVVFLVMYLSPGDPAVQMYGAQPGVTREMIEAARHDMGLDKPFHAQYLFWIGNLLQGDMGQSYVNHLPVSEVIGQKLIASVELAVASLALAMLVAIPGGILAAVRHRTWVDSVLTAFISIGSVELTSRSCRALLRERVVYLRWAPGAGAPDSAAATASAATDGRRVSRHTRKGGRHERADQFRSCSGGVTRAT